LRDPEIFSIVKNKYRAICNCTSGCGTGRSSVPHRKKMRPERDRSELNNPLGWDLDWDKATAAAARMRRA